MQFTKIPSQILLHCKPTQMTFMFKSLKYSDLEVHPNIKKVIQVIKKKSSMAFPQQCSKPEYVQKTLFFSKHVPSSQQLAFHYLIIFSTFLHTFPRQQNINQEDKNRFSIFTICWTTICLCVFKCQSFMPYKSFLQA